MEIIDLPIPPGILEITDHRSPAAQIFRKEVFEPLGFMFGLWFVAISLMGPLVIFLYALSR